MGEGKLEKRIVVVTGVSRREGIGFAMAQRFLRDGAKVLIHSFSPDVAERSRGAGPGVVTPSSPSSAAATAEELDRAWAVNARAAVLFTRRSP
jgi:NAD(P)-dependent dehydrogenase (short-subunit alcohol dehydrogenase family)